jgi:hypothetical protein
MTEQEYRNLIPPFCQFPHFTEIPYGDACWGITASDGPFFGKSPEEYCATCEYNKYAVKGDGKE